MKAKIFFTCLVFCFAWQVNSQVEFAPIGAEWYYNCCSHPFGYFNRIVSETDTVVEENNCRVLRQYSGNSNVVSEEYIIKQEQGKIYYYYQEQFNLLFDFDAEVNDIVEFTFKYRIYDDNYLFRKDSILSLRFEVENITTNAQNLKTFTTKIVDEDKDKGMYGYLWSYSYTEKIGLGSEFMPVLNNLPSIPLGEQFLYLRCYSDSDLSFISAHWQFWGINGYYPCNYSFNTSINTPKNENTKIYPNPFSDNIFVTTFNGENIEIIDISGRIVYYSELSNGINEISTGHFLKGIYFAKIRNKDDSIQTFKIVK